METLMEVNAGKNSMPDELKKIIENLIQNDFRILREWGANVNEAMASLIVASDGNQDTAELGRLRRQILQLGHISDSINEIVNLEHEMNLFSPEEDKSSIPEGSKKIIEDLIHDDFKIFREWEKSVNEAISILVVASDGNQDSAEGRRLRRQILQLGYMSEQISEIVNH